MRANDNYTYKGADGKKQIAFFANNSLSQKEFDIEEIQSHAKTKFYRSKEGALTRSLRTGTIPVTKVGELINPVAKQDSVFAFELEDIRDAIRYEAVKPKDIDKFYQSSGWVQLPFFILKSDEYIQLSYSAKVVLMLVLMTQRKTNNGWLEVPKDMIKKKGISPKTLNKAFKDLVQARILFSTSTGHKRRFAVFWRDTSPTLLDSIPDLERWVNQQREYFSRYEEGKKCLALHKKARDKINSSEDQEKDQSTVGNYVQLHHFLLRHPPLAKSGYSTIVVLVELLMSLDKKSNGKLKFITSETKRRKIDPGTRRKGLEKLKELGIILETQAFDFPNVPQEFAIFWRPYDIMEPQSVPAEEIKLWIERKRKLFSLETKGKEPLLRYKS